MTEMNYDMIIVGGGMVGSVLALSLAQHTSLSIAVLESQPSAPTWDALEYHHRVSAITLSSKRIFQSLDVWQSIQDRRVSPFTQIQVWDGCKQGEIYFNSQEIAEPVLGYIIENDVIQLALIDKLRTCPNIHFYSAIQLNELHEDEHGVILQTSNHGSFHGKLAIAADGAHSWLRKTAGIPLHVHDYHQSAIVVTVKTTDSHQQVARQVFLEEGPLAFLPLAEPYTSSIVWSLPKEKAMTIMSLDKEAFSAKLTQAFTKRLGEVVHVGERYLFPLVKQQAKHYVKSHIVLVGDAAHTVHPLAGQGVNIGLLDAVSLTEILSEAVKQGRAINDPRILRHYERWRKADNLPLLTGIHCIQHLFANHMTGMASLRSFGLKMTNQFPVIKNIFMRYAVGNRIGLPKLALASYTPLP